MIPKIIHYCWLSGDPIPESYQYCMNTWKEKLSDYEFILWDTTRFDINSLPWTRQAFETELFACAADYIRLYAVYHHGGIYLDIDIEVIKPFDELLEKDIFLAEENNVNHNIEAGCFGAEKGHPFIKKCMEYFEERNLFDPSLLPQILALKKSERHKAVNPLILPEIMKNTLDSYFSCGEYQLYPYTYFTAKNIVTGIIEADETTFTVHHFATQYHSKEWREVRELKQKIFARFGEKSLFVKFLIKTISLMQRLDEDGFLKTAQYHFNKASRMLFSIRFNLKRRQK